MDYFEIIGQNHLQGELEINGSKNAVLPLIAASILNENSVQKFTNVPLLSDTLTILKLLEEMGSSVKKSENSISIDNSTLKNPFAPYDLVKTMRASFYVLGPLIAKFGKARISDPGGCSWGPRPIDFHIKGLELLGVDFTRDHGYLSACTKGLKGSNISFPKISVGATGNVVMAAVLAKGKTKIFNASSEPEIQQLCNYLNIMGAQISGIGSNELVIEGVSSLTTNKPIEVIPDRIEAGTFLIAAAAVGGEVQLSNVVVDHLSMIIQKLRETNVQIETNSSSVRIKSNPSTLKAVDLETSEYPGFPTDLQAQWMSLMSVVNGDSKLKENIYFDRFTHVPELNRLGCNISLNKNTAKIKGQSYLSGAQIMSTDIRASAALIIAALCAEGLSRIDRIYHIDRGYYKIEDKLSKIGANIVRKKT